MSFNHNFYTNYNRNNLTFHTDFPPPTFIPPPPVPPQFYIPPIIPAPQTIVMRPQLSDQDFAKGFESKVNITKKAKKLKLPSISEVRKELSDMVLSLNDLKDKQKLLLDKVNTLTETEWELNMKQAEVSKAKIDKILSQINDNYLDSLRKAISKRAAKRIRLKKSCLEKKREKEEWIKQCKERSRKIDENLQKIKHDIDKMKKDKEAKIQADSVLKEVLRKKHDSKKCLVKLDALLKLRKARQNTAKGRGENISENEAAAFDKNIEKLKLLWTQKLSIYEQEESELRAKLKEGNLNPPNTLNDIENEVLNNLSKWRQCLFGDSEMFPQNNFNGDVEKFIAIRMQWDQFINDEGSPMPVGWVVPAAKL